MRGAANTGPPQLPRPIAALTWTAVGSGKGVRWLLPAAAVLEVIRCPTPTPLPLPLDTDPKLAQVLLGTLVWRRRRLPLLQLHADVPGDAPAGTAAPGPPEHDADAESGGEAGGKTGQNAGDAQPLRLRALVCPSLHEEGVDAYALAALGMPGLVTLREGEIEPDGAMGSPPAFAAALLRVRGELHAVPDMDALGVALAPLSALMASQRLRPGFAPDR